MATDEIAAPERPREHRENRKKNLERHVLPNQARCVAKYVRVPPRKARLVMDAVRGQYAVDALALLRVIPNRAAGFITKAVVSAVANAANNHGLNPDNLKLVETRVDEGPRLKRLRARAQGRAYRILKRTSHITIIVQEVAPKPRKPRKGAVRTRAQAAREARLPKVGPDITTEQAPSPIIPTPAIETAAPVQQPEARAEEPEGAETTTNGNGESAEQNPTESE
jgi:large subunit ribosomal protein L22